MDRSSSPRIAGTIALLAWVLGFGCAKETIEALDAGAPAVDPPFEREALLLDERIQRIDASVVDSSIVDARLAEATSLDASSGAGAEVEPPTDVPPLEPPAAQAPTVEAKRPPIVPFTGAASVIVADGRAPRLWLLDRQGALLGEQSLPGVAFGVRHDRREKDGYWGLFDLGNGPTLVKREWSGRQARRLVLGRSELRQARRLRGLDFVFGRRAEDDLLLILYDNVRGVPVVEGILARTGETRFATRFAGGDFAGLRAETYRHGPVRDVIMLEWWVAKDGRTLELWRYSRGFLSRQEGRPLPMAITGFDLPPWREVWGTKDGFLVRIPPNGPDLTLVPLAGLPGAISIDQ